MTWMIQVTWVTRVTQVTQVTGWQEASQTIDRMVYLLIILHIYTHFLDKDMFDHLNYL